MLDSCLDLSSLPCESWKDSLLWPLYVKLLTWTSSWRRLALLHTFTWSWIVRNILKSWAFHHFLEPFPNKLRNVSTEHAACASLPVPWAGLLLGSLPPIHSGPLRYRLHGFSVWMLTSQSIKLWLVYFSNKCINGPHYKTSFGALNEKLKLMKTRSWNEKQIGDLHSSSESLESIYVPLQGHLTRGTFHSSRLWTESTPSSQECNINESILYQHFKMSPPCVCASLCSGYSWMSSICLHMFLRHYLSLNPELTNLARLVGHSSPRMLVDQASPRMLVPGLLHHPQYHHAFLLHGGRESELESWHLHSKHLIAWDISVDPGYIQF